MRYISVILHTQWNGYNCTHIVIEEVYGILLDIFVADP